MNRMRVYEDAQNLISRWPGSTTNMREGLRVLADAYLGLLDELHAAERELGEIRDRANFQP